MRALYLSDTNRRKLGVVRELALKHNATVNAVVLAYLTSQPLPTVPIIGASSSAGVSGSSHWSIRRKVVSILAG